jgi:hypothetical protein
MREANLWFLYTYYYSVPAHPRSQTPKIEPNREAKHLIKPTQEARHLIELTEEA